MSDVFEAPAEPVAASSDRSEGDLIAPESSPPASSDSTGTDSLGLTEGAERDSGAPARPKRAPRRAGSRARRAEAPAETPPPPDPGIEPAVEITPSPRRRRSRKAAAEPVLDGSGTLSTPLPEAAGRLPAAEEVPPPAAALPGEIQAAVHSLTPADPDSQAGVENGEGSIALFERSAELLVPGIAKVAPPEAEQETGVPEATGIAGAGELDLSAVEPGAEAPETAERGDGEEEGGGEAPKRRRSRRGSRGGRRSRGRRATAEVEAGPVDENGSGAAFVEPPGPVVPTDVSSEALPLFETPLPDVMVHFRPVARRREITPAESTGVEGPAGTAAGAETAEPAGREAMTEGEPASRGRRRRRRGERGDREARASGVGGALPPRADPGERPVEAEDEAESEAPVAGETAAEALPERPKVERAGRGQRGERVLERAAARAEREAARAAEKETEKGERLAKEIVINVSPRETRIAVLENARLVELHVEREERVVGSVFKGKVANVLPGMDAAFVEIGLDRNAWLHVGDILFDGGEDGSPNHKRPRDLKIRDVAKPGQEILVQVVKGPRGTKGARVSTRMSLPGRYIVLMPDAENLGVSRKIEEPAERDRLKRIGERLRPAGFGVIIRTEAEERTEEDLRQDLDMLLKQWEQITERSRKVKAPALIHQDLSLILKTIRDVFGADVDKLILDSSEDYENVREMLAILSPDLIDRVHLYAEPEPIFAHYGLEDEIERLLRRKVWLRSGGYIAIDASEALTAIDVNTGKFVGSTSFSETILKTNLDAVQEIARQLRLRDIGGMIVLDFIDMNSARDRAQVMAALDKALKKDRTRTKVAHISPLGLIEMTRKRTGETVTDLITETCEYCQGRGRTLSPETMSIQIERAIRRKCAEADCDAVLVHAHPEVCAHLIGPEGENVEAIERLLRRPIYVRACHDYHVEKFELLPCDMLEIEKQLLPFRGGQVVECEVKKLDLIAAPRSAAWVDGYFVDLANGIRFQGVKTRVRLTDVRRSFALGEPVAPATALDKSEPI